MTRPRQWQTSHHQGLRALLLCLGLSLNLLGCHPKGVTPGVKPPVYPSQIVMPPLDTVKSTLEQRRQQALTSLTAPFELLSEANGKKERINGAMAVMSQPEPRLRLEMFLPIGTPAMYAVMRPEEANLFLPYNGKLLLSSDDPIGMVQRVSGGSLSLAGLTQALLGAPPPCEIQPPLSYEASDGWLVANCAGGSALLLNPADLRVRGIRLQETSEAGGQTFLLHLEAPFEASLAPGATAASRILPSDISLESSSSGGEMRLRLSLKREDVVANPALDLNLFKLELPEDVQAGSLESWLLMQGRTGR